METTTTVTSTDNDKPLTLGKIKNHAILIIVGFFVVSILTSFISTNAFQWNTKSDIKEIKTFQVQSVEKDKKIEGSIEVLSKEFQEVKTATMLNTQSMEYLKEKVNKLEENDRIISSKQDEIIRLLLQKK